MTYTDPTSRENISGKYRKIFRVPDVTNTGSNYWVTLWEPRKGEIIVLTEAYYRKGRIEHLDPINPSEWYIDMKLKSVDGDDISGSTSISPSSLLTDAMKFTMEYSGYYRSAFTKDAPVFLSIENHPGPDSIKFWDFDIVMVGTKIND
jgi:hypothetical protein